MSTGNTQNIAKRIIFLWSTRRVLSTPLHRAIFQLDGIKHFCEPFALPFYFGANPISVQFKDNHEEIASNWDRIPTFEEGLEKITNNYSLEGFEKVFVKEHAIYAYPDKIPDDILCSAANSFIIRTPEKAIKSLYRQTLAKFEDSVWDRMVVEEVGYHEQWLMYDKIVNKLGQNAIIIDADDLMANPRDILINYCKFVGLEYNEKMLDWSNDKNINDKPWDFIPISWVSDVKSTTGFRKQDKVQDEGIEYPAIVQDTIDANMCWYQRLYDQRLKL